MTASSTPNRSKSNRSRLATLNSISWLIEHLSSLRVVWSIRLLRLSADITSVSMHVLLLLSCDQSVRELLEMADNRWQRKSEATGRPYGDNITAVVAKITNVG